MPMLPESVILSLVCVACSRFSASWSFSLVTMSFVDCANSSTMLRNDWISSRKLATSGLPLGCDFLAFPDVGLVVVADVDVRGRTEYEEGMVMVAEEEGKLL